MQTTVDRLVLELAKCCQICAAGACNILTNIRFHRKQNATECVLLVLVKELHVVLEVLSMHPVPA
jgi:hypothetical protein